MTTLAEAQKVRDHLLEHMPEDWMTGTQVCYHAYSRAVTEGTEVAVTRYLKQMAAKGLIDHRLVPRGYLSVHEFRRLPDLQKETSKPHTEETV
jgi:hypothetical protein